MLIFCEEMDIASSVLKMVQWAEDNGCGLGRMSEPLDIITRMTLLLNDRKSLSLKGRKVFVTSGPTREPLDPMCYITNRSSGRQGHAIAESLACFGAGRP